MRICVKVCILIRTITIESPSSYCFRSLFSIHHLQKTVSLVHTINSILYNQAHEFGMKSHKTIIFIWAFVRSRVCKFTNRLFSILPVYFTFPNHPKWKRKVLISTQSMDCFSFQVWVCFITFHVLRGMWLLFRRLMVALRKKWCASHRNHSSVQKFARKRIGIGKAIRFILCIYYCHCRRCCCFCYSCHCHS